MKSSPNSRVPSPRIGAILLVSLWLADCTPAWSQALPAESRPRPSPRASSGDQSERGPVSFPIPGPLQNSLRQRTAAPTQSIAPRGANDPNYWIVSSRHCKDQLELGLPCDFTVCRFDGPAGARCSSLDELYASVAPNVPVCVMVHGSFVVWDSVLKDSAGTYRWLRNAAPERPVQMIFYTWPSDDTSRLLPNAIDTHDARILGRRAELNSLYLAQLVSRIPESNPICLMGHSHGARMVAASLHLLAGGMVEGRFLKGGSYKRQQIRTVLAAAAMDHDWFNPGQRFDLALSHTEAVVNLQNRHDLPLFFHPTHHLFAARALGRSGVTPRDQCLLADNSCRISDCDVTDLIGCRHVWPYYYHQPAIACAIRPYVYFDN